MRPELIDLYRQVVTEITAVHGDPAVRLDEPVELGGNWELTAAWSAMVNRGLRITDKGDAVVVATWDHGLDASFASVTMRDTGQAERWLRQILPPALVRKPLPLHEPNSCTHCGVPRREHCQRWTTDAGVGWHGWVAPTDKQRLARMKARREAAGR